MVYNMETITDRIINYDIQKSLNEHSSQITNFKALLEKYGSDWNNVDLLDEGNKLFFDNNRRFYEYDKQAIEKRAESRLGSIKKRFPNISFLGSYCDIGCGHGENPRMAVNYGFSKSVGIDIVPQWEEYYTNEIPNLEFIQMDISKDEYYGKFDFATSFAAFEHFEDPEKMLDKMVEMILEGGYLYIEFSPIWRSTDGHHMYRLIQFPYYHLIFSDDVIEAYYNRINFKERYYFNKWTALDFMSLFLNVKNMQIVHYEPFFEMKDLYFIKTFPMFFEGFSTEELIISGFRLLYKKL